MKGAPEKVIARCSKVMVEDRNGITEKPITQRDKYDINKANTDLGFQGERVLALAKIDLNPDVFHGDYRFDTKHWKEWGGNPQSACEEYLNIQGSFPMHELTLISLVSFHDPPAPQVSETILKCR